LRNAYTGSCIRVRRSSDNAELDIGFTSTGVLDTAALLAHVGAGNGFVTTWYDQSGSVNNAVQATGGSQPRIVNGGVLEVVNTKACMNMNGTTQHLQLTNTITPTSSIFSSFGVAKRNASSQSFTLYGFNASSPNNALTHLIVSSNNRWYFQRSTSYIESNSTDTTNAQILATGISGAAFQQFKNGTIITSTNFNLTINNSINYIGRYTNTIPLYHNGQMQELIIYTSDQASNRTAIESNIMNYYGI
jgi:hypothetical protein